MSEPISNLRRHMIEDMKIRNMAALTQAVYVRAVKNFAAFHGNSPDKLSFEDVRTYQLHSLSRGLQPLTINQIICALRFFYAVTLHKPEAKTELPLARRADTLPAVLSPEEVARFLNAVADLKQRAAFTTTYAAGLRVSEVVALTLGDIDSARMVSLATGEFIRRFLMHTLPGGFHRIRYYGFAANGHRAEKLALCRELLDITLPPAETGDADPAGDPRHDAKLPCPCCGGRMITIEIFDRPPTIAGLDSS
jgi:hypothetical protein